MSPMTKRPFKLEYALLGYLYQRPLHGYQILQQLSAANGLGLVWRLKQSQLYALLKSLESEGYLTSVIQDQESYPPRRVFELTQSGRKVFLEWVRTPTPTPRQIRQEFLAKLYFSQEMGKENAAELIRKQQQVCASWLVEYETIYDRLDADKIYERMVLRYRILQIEMILRWLEQCRQILI